MIASADSTAVAASSDGGGALNVPIFLRKWDSNLNLSDVSRLNCKLIGTMPLLRFLVSNDRDEGEEGAALELQSAYAIAGR